MPENGHGLTGFSGFQNGNADAEGREIGSQISQMDTDSGKWTRIDRIPRISKWERGWGGLGQFGADFLNDSL
jgi:hypothetical protein